MKLTTAYITKQGNREYNEDYGIALEQQGNYCFVVADGLGGHGRGDEASQSVCATAQDYFAKSVDHLDIEHIFEFAQSKLLQLQEEEKAYESMKTTMNVVLIEGNEIKWGHVGDTRTYYFYKGKVKERTKDHSVPQMMVNMGEIKEKDIRHHPDRNRLLKVMGIQWDKPQYTIEKSIKLSKNQVFLLCTDGFWELIDEKNMEKLLKQAKTAQEWLSLMETVILENGKDVNMDNYTAMAIWIEK